MELSNAYREIQIELDLRTAGRARTVRGEKKAADVAITKQPASLTRGRQLCGSATGWPRRQRPRTAALPAGTGPSRTVPPARTRRIRRDIAALPTPVPTASRVSASGSNSGRCACNTPCRNWCRRPNRRLVAPPWKPRAAAGTRIPPARRARVEPRFADLYACPVASLGSQLCTARGRSAAIGDPMYHRVGKGYLR